MKNTIKSQTVDDVLDEHLECRDYMHSWKPYSAKEVQKGRVVERVLRCERCKTLKKQTLVIKRGRAFLSTGSYKYSQGYLIKGMGHITQEDKAKLRFRTLVRELGDV
jgi:hypothetical protein